MIRGSRERSRLRTNSWGSSASGRQEKEEECRDGAVKELEGEPGEGVFQSKRTKYLKKEGGKQQHHMVKREEWFE